MSKNNNTPNIFGISINVDNEATILSSSFHNTKCLELLAKKIAYFEFRQKLYQNIAWALIEICNRKLKMEIDTVLLYTKTSPVQQHVTIQILNDLFTNYPPVPESNFQIHIDTLQLDSVKSALSDSLRDNMYRKLLNPDVSIAELQAGISKLNDIAEKGYTTSKSLFQPMSEVVPEYKDHVLNGKKFRTTGFRQLDEKLNEGFREGGVSIICGLPGSGKCLNLHTKILMYNGSIKLAKDIVVGDELMGVDSTPREVLRANRGRGQMYKIKQIKGDDYIVNGPHVLALRRSKNQYHKADRKLPIDQRRVTRAKGELVEIEVKDYIEKVDGWKQQYKGYKVDGWDLPERSVTLEPYYMGIHIGDGACANQTISNPDSEIHTYLKSYADRLGMNYYQKLDSGGSTCYVCKITKKGGHTNYVKDQLRNYGLINNGKFVPDDYKYNTREVRLQVLAGLIDSDGYHNRNCFEISTKYEKLKDDILYLARSLGFYTSSNYEKKQIKSINFSGMYWRIQISGHTDRIPTKVKRKQAGPRKQIKDVLNTGITVKPLDIDEYVAIILPQETDQLFILGDGTVTHNSSLTLSVMKNLSNKHIHTAQFALEMDKMSITTKLLAFYSRMAVSRLTKNFDRLNKNERKLWEHILDILSKNEYLYINDKPGQSLSIIREQIMILQDRLKTEYIVTPIDLFGKIKDFAGSDNFARDYETKLNEVQSMAKELQNHFILVAQINRSATTGKFKRPGMHHLKNAGAFEEVADIIYAVHRPFYNPEVALKKQLELSEFSDEDFGGLEEADPNENLAEVILLKQRMGPGNLITNFYFNPTTTCFSPMSADFQLNALEATQNILHDEGDQYA